MSAKTDHTQRLLDQQIQHGARDQKNIVMLCGGGRQKSAAVNA